MTNAKKLEWVMMVSGLVVAIPILLTLPWTGRPGYYLGLDACAVLAPMLVARLLPRRNVSRGSALMVQSKVSPIAGLSFFLSLALLILLLGYVAFFAAYYRTTPDRSHVATVANHILGICVMLGCLMYFNRPKPTSAND